MMMPRVILLVILNCAFAAVHAQSDDPVGRIQTEIRRIEQSIADGVDAETPRVHTIDMRSVLPGSGPQATTIRMHYEESPRSADSWELVQTLRKAEVRGNVSAVVFLKEYYYQDGRLIGFTALHDVNDSCTLVRVLFHRETPVASEWRSKEIPCTKISVTHRQKASLPVEISQAARSARSDAKELMRLFSSMGALNTRLMGGFVPRHPSGSSGLVPGVPSELLLSPLICSWISSRSTVQPRSFLFP